MQPPLKAGSNLRQDRLVRPSPYARLPRLDLEIDWENRGREFPGSLASLFRRPRAPKDWETARNRILRVKWIEGRLPFRACTLSSLGHVGLVWLLTLPIWGFLPASTPNLAPVQISLAWYSELQDLPPISLPARTPQPVAQPENQRQFHPRQTILSIPVRVTHPRQTLIRPDAPMTPPKIVPPLPNIVEWKAAQPQLEKPRFQLSATESAPTIHERTIENVAAPEVANNEKNPGPMNIAPRTVALARPKIPLSAMSAPKARQVEAAGETAAPEVGAGDSATGNLIALSATPGPPAPVASVPEGNLAARISMGTSPGEQASREAGGATTGGLAGTSSLPAAVSISRSPEPHATTGGVAAGRAGGLNLAPRETYPPAGGPRRGPMDLSRLAPGLPPEKILSGSEIYTMHINLPNVTSATGSWILNFTELDEDPQPGYRPKQRLADPVPVHVTDPKYPQEAIKGHVHGEVVLYAIIRKNGSVDSIQIVHDLDPELDQNAINALEKWTFEPARRAGVPVDVEAVIHVPFSYTDPREYPSTP